MNDFLIGIGQLIDSASSTEITSRLTTFAGRPLMYIIFGVTAFLTALMVVKRVVVLKAVRGAGRIIAGGGRRGRRRR